MVSPAAGESVPLDGYTVTRFQVDDSVTLFLRSGAAGEGRLRIDGPADFQAAGGKRSRIAVEEDPVSAGPLFAVLFARVQTAMLDETGALVIGFGGGARLTLASDEHFVAWDLTLDTGYRAVCLADGDVLVRPAAAA